MSDYRIPANTSMTVEDSLKRAEFPESEQLFQATVYDVDEQQTYYPIIQAKDFEDAYTKAVAFYEREEYENYHVVRMDNAASLRRKVTYLQAPTTTPFIK